MLNKKYDNLLPNIHIRAIMIIRDRNPPLKLSRPAMTPLVAMANIDFNTAMAKACLFLRKKSAYITAMFESPNFTPGTDGISTGMLFSTIERISAIANRSADRTRDLVFFEVVSSLIKFISKFSDILFFLSIQDPYPVQRYQGYQYHAIDVRPKLQTI